jgi:flagellar hook protein FlgE
MKTPRKKKHTQTYKRKKDVYKTVDILNNKLTNKINFTKLSCSPKKELAFTCFTKEELMELKNAWNRMNADKINTNDVYFQDTKAKDSKFEPVTLLFLHHPIFPGEIYTSCGTVRYQHILLAS